MKSLIAIAIATVIGLVIVPVITLAGILIVGPVVSFFLPTHSDRGMGFANLGIGVVVIFIVYFLSTLVAGFITGFLIYRWGLKTDSQIWQGFIGGFVIGFSPPILLYRITITGLIYIAVLGLASGITGLVGYYVASRRQGRLQSSE